MLVCEMIHSCKKHKEFKTMRVFLGLCCLVITAGFQFPSLSSLFLHHQQPKQTKNTLSKSQTTKVVAAATLAWGLFLGGPDSAHAVGDQVFNEVWGIVNENFVDNTYNGHDWKKTKDEYIKQLERGADEHDVTKKMLELLGDKYTRLLDKAYFESIWKYDAIGVGLLFQSDPNKEMVVASPPVGGSSAYKAGFQKGDIIYAINGMPTDKMTAMTLLDMMSNDKSPTVTLEYRHVNDLSADKMSIALQRTTEKAINPVQYFSQTTTTKTNNNPTLKTTKNIGYIRLSEFNAEAVPGLRTALVELQKQNVEDLVLDLRGNTGGGFQFALNIGGMFMDNKDMVTAKGRNDEQNVFKSSFPDGVLSEKPLIILTDGLSASASEVLAGGLHDNCRAVVAGATTFGKGKIQAVFGLSNGEGLTMTVAQYVTPRGTVIQSKGIQPDIPISTMNPYVALLTGPSMNKVDLDKIDYDKAENLLTMCQAGKI